MAPETLDRLIALLEEAVAARLVRTPPMSSASAAPSSPVSVPAEPAAGLAPLWSLAQEHLNERLPPAVFAECIRPARLLAVRSDGEVMLGVPNASVRRKLERHWLPSLEDVLATLLARPVRVRIVTFAEWGEHDASSA